MTKLTLRKIDYHKRDKFIGLKFIGKYKLSFCLNDIVAYDIKNIIVKTIKYNYMQFGPTFKEQIIHKLKIIRKYK